jgi:oligopeptide/dipeptide ABC transporter ATP-binding protein
MSPLLRIVDLEKKFPLKGGIADFILKKPKSWINAVDRVSLDIYPGDSLGLVGESGCGKSSLAKTLIRLYRPDGGRIILDGRDISRISRGEMRREARNIQMIFQDPFSSLNPRMTVREILREALAYHNMRPRAQMDNRVTELMNLVGLYDYQADRVPGGFSGGQRQRIGIARALALEPKLIIADEPVSALDVSIQAQVINLLIDLRQKLGLTLIFISHDLRVVRYVTDRTAVMYLGKILELAPTRELFENPLHPYTELLFRSAPRIEARPEDREIPLSGELPSPINPPPGCRFHPRCPRARPECAGGRTELIELSPGHFSACLRNLRQGATLPGG